MTLDVSRAGEREGAPDLAAAAQTTAARQSGPGRAMPVLILFVVGALWGIQPTLIKSLTERGYDEIATLWWTLTCVALALGAILAARGRLFRPSRDKVLFLSVGGATEFAWPIIAIFLISRHLDAGLLTLILSTGPVFTVTIAAALGAEALTRNSTLAAAIGLVAMGLILVPEGALPSAEMLPWCLAAFTVPIAYSFGCVYISKAWPADMDPMQVAFGGSVMASLIVVPFWLGAFDTGQPDASPEGGLWTFVVLVGSMIVDIVLYFYLVRTAGPVFTSFNCFFTIVAGFVAGAIVFGERPSGWIWASVALFSIALAMILTVKSAPRGGESLSDRGDAGPPRRE